MTLARKAAVALVALALTTTLVTANVVAAAHLTVLDPGFVTTSVEEEGGYDLVEDVARGAAGIDGSTTETGPVDTESLLREALSEEYVRSQTEANVNRTYAYLHGDADELNLSMSTAPIRENVSAGIERQLRNASLVELVERSDAELSDPVNATVLERMTANRSSYRQVKADVRAHVRERVLDAAVDRAFEEASNDDLIEAMGEDPDDYTEAQKERFVREYEPEIRAEIRDRIERERGDEIERRVDEELATLRAQATDTSAETETERAVADVQATVARGLTADMSYSTFQANLSESKARLAAAAAERADRRLDEELPARVDLTENVSGGAERGFENARTTVVWFDRLTFVLPVLAIGLVGLLYYLRRSVTKVASDAGISLLAAGVPTLVGVGLARSQLGSLAENAPPERRELMAVMVGVVERGLGTFGDIALVLVVTGVLFVGASLAVRYQIVEKVRDRLRDDGEDRGTL